MKVLIDTDSCEGMYGLNDPTVFHSEEEFRKAHPGELPHPLVLGKPDRYPVLVFDMGEHENFQGREISELLFFYDFVIYGEE